jgi:hypothetical protein
MVQTITVDIINQKALKLLQELEQLQLIRLRREDAKETKIDWKSKYKGAMTKQPLSEIDGQIDELRAGWE